MMGFLHLLLAIMGISVLVIIHELGHYLMARAFGMRVTRFSIGLGPVLFRHQPKNSPTVFQVCAVPFLAYVAIAGMNPHEEVKADDPGIFSNKSWIARVLTIAGGPVANYLTASILVLGIALTGWPEEVPLKPMVVGQVSPGSPAALAGLKAGDVVREANNQTIRDIDDLIRATSPRANTPTVYRVDRPKVGPLVFTIVPKAQGTRAIIGVSPKTERLYVKKPLGESLVASVVFPWALTKAQLSELGSRFRQGSMEGISGPVGMGKLVAQQAGQGPVEYISILMLLSVALGMFNLLPIPALDGGRLVFLAYEAVMRRRPNERVEALVHTVGLVVLLGLLALVTLRDLKG